MSFCFVVWEVNYLREAILPVKVKNQPHALNPWYNWLATDSWQWFQVQSLKKQLDFFFIPSPVARKATGFLLIWKQKPSFWFRNERIAVIEDFD